MIQPAKLVVVVVDPRIIVLAKLGYQLPGRQINGNNPAVFVVPGFQDQGYLRAIAMPADRRAAARPAVKQADCAG